MATLHAVFVPNAEAAVVAYEQSVTSSARQLVRRISARLRRSGSVSVFTPPSGNIMTQSPRDQFTAGCLRIAVIDHG